MNAFECTTSSVRDKYDVYTYANLHVPMGCKDIYSAAYEWRYFNKIKEDMEMNGKTYYAKLMVKQGTTGYTEQNVKADETYTIYIGSLGGNTINSITFNGVDVTDQLFDGYYTTPAIKGKSTLSVTYETGASSVKDRQASNIKVTGHDGIISVENIDTPADVSIYSTNGILVDSVSNAVGSATMEVENNHMYVVKVGNRTFKLAL